MKRSLGLWMLLFAVLGFWLNTRQNHFPFYYHPDEVKKVNQILSGERNFNHPLLLLNTVELAWKFACRPTDRQAVVEIGRNVSAGFIVLGTLAFMLAAWRWRGAFAGVATGAWLTLHQQVFELAHYFKEDTALYFGVGLFALSAVLFWQKPNWKQLAFLSVSVALATSAKYLGAILLVPTLVLLWRCPVNQKRRATFSAFIGIFLTVCVLINLPIFFRLDIFESSLSREMNWAVMGEKDVTRSVPHSIYLNIFLENTSPFIWLLLAALVTHLIRRKPNDRFLAWSLLGTLLIWILLLSFSPKTNDRYFLPLTGIIGVLAGGGLTTFRPDRRWIAAGIVLGALAWEIQKTREYYHAFASDDRADLVQWIHTNIPATDTIAYDTKVNLPDIEVYHELEDALPHRLLRKFYVADVGSPEFFKQENIRYVIVTESTYGRFFLSSLKVKSGQSEDFNRRAAFYEKLRQQKPLWSRPRSTVLYLHPGLEVYRYGN